MYVQAQGSVIALDAVTGGELWKRQGAGAGRGINYWESKDGKDRRLLFVNQGALTAIHAMDAQRPV